ncbi:M20/M25/M40 family metallo-hydrolase [bacterium]|nr:M20/M25/M40 family metallo-hydrolase [bacterium]
MHTILKQKNGGLKQPLIRFAQDLVATPSVSLDEKRVAVKVHDQMRVAGYDNVFTDEFGNVVGIMHGSELEPAVLLVSHMDTVSPGDAASDAGIPAPGTIRAGKLYGLGASDCKGGLAAQVFAGALLKRSLLPLRGTLVVAATVAEENGRSIGVRGLIEHTLPKAAITPSFAVLGEPTGLGLYYGHDGWAELEVRVEGANPFLVDDAAEAIADDLDAAAARRGAEQMRVCRPFLLNDNGMRRASILMSCRVPEAVAVVDLVNKVKHDAGLATQHAGTVNVSVAVTEARQELYTTRATCVRNAVNAWTTDPFSPVMERARHALAAAGMESRPGKWRLGRLGMGTAGSVLVSDFSIPTIGFGPGEEDLAHQPGEYVELDRMHDAVYGTAAIVHSLVGIPVCGWTSDDI